MLSDSDDDMPKDITNIGFDSSDEDDDVKRVVVKKTTANERLIADTLDEIYQNIVDDEYETIPAAVIKVNRSIKKIKLDWEAKLRIPRFYIKRIVEIQELLVKKKKAELKKNLLANEFRYFIRLQGDFKKLRHVEYSHMVAAYSLDPTPWDGEPSDPEDEKQRKEDSEKEEADSKEGNSDEAGFGDNDSESDWDNISDVSSDDEEDSGDDGADGAETYGPWSAKQVKKMKNRDFWLLKDEQDEESSGEAEQARLDKREQERLERQRKNELKKLRAEKEESRRIARGKLTHKKLSTEDVCKRLKKIWLSRHKKADASKDPLKDLESLKQWIDASYNPEMYITLLSLQVTLGFDTTGVKQIAVTIELYKQIVEQIQELLNMLETNKMMRIHPNAEMKFLDVEDKEEQKKKSVFGGIISGIKKKKELTEEEQDALKEEQRRQHEDELARKGFNPEFTYIRGNLEFFMKRLCQDWHYSLKNIGMQLHHEKYMNRMEDRNLLLRMLARTRDYLLSIEEKGNQKSDIAMLALQELRIRHSMYDEKCNVLCNPESESHTSRLESSRAHMSPVLGTLSSGATSTSKLVVDLAKLVWSTPDAGHKLQITQAVLYLVFYLALHNDFRNARNLLQMSHLCPGNNQYLERSQVKWYIGMCEPSTQLIYNRCICQLAIAAFHQGRFDQCSEMLFNLYSSGKIKELMAQYVKIDWWKREKTDKEMEIEANEHARLLPEHLHFNTNMLESLHLIAAMFKAIPGWVTTPHRKFIRKWSFRYYFEQFLRRETSGRIGVDFDQTKYAIMESGKAMSQGDWRTCYSKLADLKFWNELKNIDVARHFVKEEVKKQSLRCYLERYGALYKSIRMDKLVERFKLTRRNVQKYVSRFCVDYTLRAQYDQITDCYIVTRGVATPIQKLSLAYSDKLNQLMETNERLAGRPGSFGRRPKQNQSKGTSNQISPTSGSNTIGRGRIVAS